ncbi:tryptophan synthase subunit alpha [Nicoliella lavandulae]|uniref:Tryptophan synthase alpha chain n=1 Tax=Nicoliella lavandulae TaxID=3082954 RepID=A0ABU8SML5_9LACO
MNKIEQAFQDHKQLIGFVTANDPDMQTTVNNVVALAKGGAGIVEIGIPFSDPVADGPVIQKADLRALRDPELSLQRIFTAVDEIRTQTNVPLVFLTYLNVVLQYGYERFCQDCQKHGVSGAIIPDLPYEEQDELLPLMNQYQLALIQLITLNSGSRIEKIAQRASGFIYLVSSLGVTGERDHFSNQLSRVVNSIKAVTDVPVAIGFGVHSTEQAHELVQFADGVIIGSAFVKLVATHKEHAPEHLSQFASEIKNAITD